MSSNPYGVLGGVGNGMMRALGMPGRGAELVALPIVATSGSGTVTASDSCIALIALWGAGGAGAVNSGFNRGAGGGSGGVVYHHVTLSRNQSLAWSCGAGATGTTDGGVPAAGGDTTVTGPSGISLIAGGGQGAQQSSAGITGGVGGVARGGRINIVGQDGQSATAGAGGTAPGLVPQFGSDFAGGAGAAGGTTAAGAIPGGGSAGNTGSSTTGAGGAGRVVIVLVKLT